MKKYLKLSFLICLLYTVNVQGQDLSQKIDSTYIELKIGLLDSVNYVILPDRYTVFGRAIPKGTILLNLEDNKIYLSGINKSNWSISNGVVMEIYKSNSKHYINKSMFKKLDYMYKSRYLIDYTKDNYQHKNKSVKLKKYKFARDIDVLNRLFNPAN